MGCIGGAKQQDAFDFRVQAAAASALARWQTLHAPAASTPGSNETWEGLHRLIRAYKVQLLLRRRHATVMPTHSSTSFLHHQERFFDAHGLPKAMSFDGRVNYELRKALIAAIASVRYRDGSTPTEVIDFCTLVLRAHDNTGNPFDDGPFLAGEWVLLLLH